MLRVSTLLWIALAAAASGACDRARGPDGATGAPTPIPISVLADTSAATRLRVAPPGGRDTEPGARAWLARVREADVTPAPAPEPPLPDARPDAPAEQPGPPALVVDEGLKPPIPRQVVSLVMPPGGVARPASVALDVLVDETGAVGEVAFAGGSDDPALVEAAVACARQMTFYPALRAGRPVAVWCRQRFDFDAR